jgi:hypothetical protein
MWSALCENPGLPTHMPASDSGICGPEVDERAELMRLIRWDELRPTTIDRIVAWCDLQASTPAPDNRSHPPAELLAPADRPAAKRSTEYGAASPPRARRTTAASVAMMRELAARGRRDRAAGERKRSWDGTTTAPPPPQGEHLGGDAMEPSGRSRRRRGGLGHGARAQAVRRTEASVYCLAASAGLGVVCAGGVDGSVGIWRAHCAPATATAGGGSAWDCAVEEDRDGRTHGRPRKIQS